MIVAKELDVSGVILGNSHLDLSTVSRDPCGVARDPRGHILLRITHAERVPYVDVVCHKRVGCATRKLGRQGRGEQIVRRGELPARNLKGHRRSRL